MWGLVPTLRVGTHLRTLRVPSAWIIHPGAIDAESRFIGFPRRAWERADEGDLRSSKWRPGARRVGRDRAPYAGSIASGIPRVPGSQCPRTPSPQDPIPQCCFKYSSR